MTESQTRPTTNTPPLLSARHQTVVAAVTLICLVTMGVYWVLEYQRRGRPINIERQGASRAPKLIIDVNRAPWHELTLLPGISETMARRIVEHRSEHGPFESLEQIQHVPGIGPLKQERLAPYVEMERGGPDAALP